MKVYTLVEAANRINRVAAYARKHMRGTNIKELNDELLSMKETIFQARENFLNSDVKSLTYTDPYIDKQIQYCAHDLQEARHYLQDAISRNDMDDVRYYDGRCRQLDEELKNLKEQATNDE